MRIAWKELESKHRGEVKILEGESHTRIRFHIIDPSSSFVTYQDIETPPFGHAYFRFKCRCYATRKEEPELEFAFSMPRVAQPQLRISMWLAVRSRAPCALVACNTAQHKSSHLTLRNQNI